MFDMIRILITGSRLWHDVPLLTASLDEQARGHDQVTLIHGRCDPRNAAGERVPWDNALVHPEDGPYRGGDWHAHQHAVVRGWGTSTWSTCGRLPMVVAAPLGKSPGSRDCMRRAKAAGIRVVDVTEPPAAEGLW